AGEVVVAPYVGMSPPHVIKGQQMPDFRAFRRALRSPAPMYSRCYADHVDRHAVSEITAEVSLRLSPGSKRPVARVNHLSENDPQMRRCLRRAASLTRLPAETPTTLRELRYQLRFGRSVGPGLGRKRR
ncbi:MAG: hypothetical protein ACPGUV_11940, partial [Polyangiales bacterium]